MNPPMEQNMFEHRLPRSLALPVAVMLTVFIGCKPPPRPVRPAAPASIPNEPVSTATATTEATAPTSTSSNAAPSPAKSIDLRAMNWEQAQAFVTEYKGKVVVVDVWSTSCEPCLQEFPHLVALQQRHPNDVVCVSFDCDYIGAKNKPLDYYRERVLKALTELQAETIVNLISTVPADDLFQQMDLDSIPAVYVFDRDSKLAKRFDNRTPVGGGQEGISYEKQIDPLVAELIQQTAEQ